MNLPKVIGPPALTVLLLVFVIYVMGSCIHEISPGHRFDNRDEKNSPPEQVISITENNGDEPITVSLYSWGASFSRHEEKLGDIRYERVYYVLEDAHGNKVWRITAHDTYVAVSDAQGNPVMTIERGKDCINFLDPNRKVISRITLENDMASLFSADGTFICRAEKGLNRSTLFGTGRDTILACDASLSAAGLCAYGLSSYTLLERMALMIMVK